MLIPTTDGAFMSTKLTGNDLKAKVLELGQLPEADAAIACGYVTAEGKAQVAAFKNALLEAHGLAFAKPSRGGGSKGKPLSFSVTAGKTGNIVLAGGYGALIGIEPGGKVAIAHQGNSLVITAAVDACMAPAAAPEPVVVTYDDSMPERTPAMAAI